jgi:hypothetical protein
LKIEIDKKFRTLKISLLSLAILSLVATTPASFASTSHTVYTAGNWTSSLTVVSVNIAPQKTTIFATITTVLTGTLMVTYVGTITIYEYVGSVCTFQSGGVDSGTLDSSATGTALVIGTGTGVCMTGGGVEGTSHFSDGTGGLAGIRGSIGLEGIFTSATTASGTYQGKLYLG